MGLDMSILRRPKEMNSEQHDKFIDSMRKKLGGWSDEYFDWYNDNVQLAYFRKHNALHGFIVNHFADGVDECQEIPLTRNDFCIIIDSLQQTIGVVEQDLADGHSVDPDSLDMPPVHGFFFGCYEIDDIFLSDLKDELYTFRNLLEKIDWEKDYIYYQASW